MEIFLIAQSKWRNIHKKNLSMNSESLLFESWSTPFLPRPTQRDKNTTASRCSQEHRTHHLPSSYKETSKKSTSGITVNPGVQEVCAHALGCDQSRTWGSLESTLQGPHRPINPGNIAHWHKGLKFNFWPDPGWQISFSDPSVIPRNPGIKINYTHYWQSGQVSTINASPSPWLIREVTTKLLVPGRMQVIRM